MIAELSGVPETALSAAQRRLWFAYKVDPASAEYTVTWAARLRGNVDQRRLAAAWRVVLERHPELRLRLSDVGGEPYRQYLPTEDFELLVTEVPPEAVSDELHAAVGRVFALDGGRLIEAVLIRSSPGEHVLLLSGHHAVLDGRSLSIVVDDLFNVYRGEALGDPGRSYLDYIAEEAATLPVASRIDAWADELRLPEEVDPLGYIPSDRSADRTAAAVELPLSGMAWEAVRHLSRRNRTTPQVIGLAAFAATLGRYSDNDELLVGGTMDTRSGPFVDTVGMFVNPVPVRVHIDPDAPVSAYIKDVHCSLLRSFVHRTVPFEELVRRLRDNLDITRTPVFQVLFNYETRQPLPDLPGLQIEHIELPIRVSLYDLMLVLRDRGPVADLVAVYRQARYSEEQVTQLVQHVARALEQLAASDSAGDFQLLSDSERDRQLEVGRGAALAGDLRPVHEIIAQLAHERSSEPAVTCGSRTLTYGELEERSAALAAALVAQGVGRETPVAILLEPTEDAVVAALAVLRAGGTYVPIHPEHPPARIVAVLADARITIVVTEEGWLSGVRTISPLAAAPRDPAPQEVDPRDAAYIIYTSGSTGEPKGVVVEHASLSASTAARRQVYPGLDKFLLLSPLSFDSSMAGLWGTLTSGGCVVVASSDDVRDPQRILDLISKNNVSMMLAVPALYATILDAAERFDVEQMRSLRTVITAGEPLPGSLVARHFRLPQTTELVNEYGPTEATVWSTYCRFRRPRAVSIGGPAPGTRLYVLDRRRRLMPWGAAGELYVGGPGVARGYVGRPDDTAAAFLPDPFAADESRMYRTGDWVRWAAAGELTFVGRRDQLVKVRGHRVDLGAVESLLRSAPGVVDAAVLPARDGSTLAAFLVADTEFERDAVRTRLAEALPPVMVPSSLSVLSALPRSRHGKLDRDALLDLVQSELTAAAPAGDSDELGSADAQVAVHAAWCQVLEVPAVGHHVNFFDAGGHSLLVPALRAELEDRLNVTVAIVDLFTATTVNAQAALFGGKRAVPVAETAGLDPRQARLAAANRARPVETQVAP